MIENHTPPPAAPVQPAVVIQSLAPDLLRGAEEISEFLFGDRAHRRRVFHLVETSKLPHFRLGSMICARRSVLTKWIEDQERRHM